MPLITRLMLQNFKKFPELDLRFSNDRNILVGDNESGKSTILLALDLVLSDSRHRVEALGVESLLSQSAVRHFQEGERRADQLPVLTADVFLSNGGEPDLNGRQNLAGIDADGLRMRIAPMMEEYGQDIHHVLQQDPDNFPYEYYSVQFSTSEPTNDLTCLDLAGRRPITKQLQPYPFPSDLCIHILSLIPTH
ncbi:AAA family ATPase, partial [Escherichia coli]|uniref:AAA family ATPase n=1 Tax=Escherichia coli TaxID=562 RepID=UPI001FCD41C3